MRAANVTGPCQPPPPPDPRLQGGTALPQLFIDGSFVAAGAELERLELSGELASLLKGSLRLRTRRLVQAAPSVGS